MIIFEQEDYYISRYTESVGREGQTHICMYSIKRERYISKLGQDPDLSKTHILASNIVRHSLQQEPHSSKAVIQRTTYNGGTYASCCQTYEYHAPSLVEPRHERPILAWDYLA